jgi:hypothetical protein
LKIMGGRGHLCFVPPGIVRLVIVMEVCPRGL